MLPRRFLTGALCTGDGKCVYQDKYNRLSSQGKHSTSTGMINSSSAILKLNRRIASLQRTCQKVRSKQDKHLRYTLETDPTLNRQAMSDGNSFCLKESVKKKWNQSLSSVICPTFRPFSVTL